MIILFVLIAPFLKIPILLILHIVFSISLLIHWANNSNVCSLSLLESKLRNIPYTQSFTHSFIGPVYDISSTDWSKICYFVTITLMIISIYNLIISPKIELFKKCISKTQKYINTNKNLKLKDKFNLYMNCTMYLFN